MLLAIDTSQGTSVAVVDRDAGVLAVRTEPGTMRHAEAVGPLIRGVLDESGIPIEALSGVVAGVGPGPFTGLRVGVATARGFAIGAGKPLVPVISHDAIALAHYRDATGPLLVVTDARRREVYVSEYSGADEYGLPIRAAEPRISTMGEVALSSLPRRDSDAVDAGDLGLLAELMYAHRRPFVAPQALYLRSPDAVPGKGKRVTG
jgi:tRNA threonylcarbamoyl adenosine modification protein YeaZ